MLVNPIANTEQIECLVNQHYWTNELVNQLL